MLSVYTLVCPYVVRFCFQFLCLIAYQPFEGYLMPKPSFKKNGSGTIQPIARRIRGFIPFPRVFCLKVNVIALLEFRLAKYDPAVHRFNHYSTRKLPYIVSAVAGTRKLPYIVSAVAGCCNYSSLVFLNVVFKSSYWCIHASLNASKSSSS